MKYALLFSCLTFSAFALSAEAPSCGTTPSPYRATARHVEGKGIGYTKGYTSVDLFLTAPWTLTHKWIPFIDGRLHVFDNGRIATNIGLGCRYATPSVVYGINSYYDYRETSRQKYNQYSLGLEALGRVWDLRLNGYLPVGQKRSAFYNTDFGYFSGYHIFLKGRRDLAMRGLNLEAGIHIKETSWMRFYGAFGPYYFGKGGNNAAGGKIRLALTFFDQIKMEGSTSYDPIFHWIGQGELSWMIPFGPKKKKTGKACSRSPRLYDRALQRVDRQEIIVISDRTYYPVARDRNTTNPYRVFFVDNTSHSAGTFESPYSTLSDAQNEAAPGDLIYVFPGDGSDTGMDAGFVMQANQKLWGSGIDNFLATSQGLVTIPAQTNTLPLITNTSGAIVTMSDNCEVAGLNCSTSNAVAYGILGGDPVNATFTVANPLLRGNTVETPNATTAAIGICPSGIATFIDCTGVGSGFDYAGIFIGSKYNNLDVTAILSNCRGTGAASEGGGIWIGPVFDDGNVIATLSNCTGTGIGGDAGILVGTQGNGNVLATLSNCVGTVELTGNGIVIAPSTGNVTATFSNCTGKGGSDGTGILVGPFNGNDNDTVTATLSNCTGKGGSGQTGIIVGSLHGNGNVIATFFNCIGTGGEGGDGIFVGPDASGDVTASLFNCSGTGEVTNNVGIWIGAGTPVTGNNVTATLSSCTGTASSGTGIYFNAPDGILDVTLSGSPALIGTGGTAGITYNSPNTTIIAE